MKFKINESFALKLSLYIITAVVIIFMFILVFNYLTSKKYILESNDQNINNLQDSTLNKIDSVLTPIQKMSEELGQVMENASLTQEEIKPILLSICKTNNEIYGCGINFEPYKFDKSKYYFDPYAYKPAGKLTYLVDDSSATEAYDYFKLDWYAKPKLLGKGVWSDPYYDKGGGDIWMVTYSQPFYRNTNGKKELLGVINCDVSLDWLQTLIGDIKVYKTGYAFLLSNKGIFIVHPNNEYFKKNMTFNDLAKKYNSPDEEEINKEMTSGKSGVIKYYSHTLNNVSYVYYQPLSRTGWSLGIVIPENELYSKLNSITLELFLIGIIGYVLTLLMILLLSSRATIPLRSLAKATRKIGQGEFNVAIPNITSHDEIGMLSSSFVAMQENLIKYVTNLQTTTAAKEKIEKELSIAREIQRSIVPHNFPSVKEFELYAELLPAREVGGDLYDFFFIDSTHLCFAIGDVSGKGVPAALFMAITKTLLRAKISLHSKPDEVIWAMNNDLFRDNESSMFVTFFLCILNIQTGELEYSNAGHNPPLLYKMGKEFEYLVTDNPSPPIGILEDAEYSTQKLKLFPEDIFFLYTDGITEAMNKDDSQYTDEKLLESMANNKNKAVIEIVNNVISAVADHASGAAQSDDITLLVLKYKG